MSSDDSVAAAHISGCEYFAQPQLNRVMLRMLEGSASNAELQQIVAIQSRQIMTLMDEMREMRQSQRQILVNMAHIRRTGSMCRGNKYIGPETATPSLSFMAWCNKWTIGRANLEQVAKNGMLSAFKQHLSAAGNVGDELIPIYASNENHKVYVYNAQMLPVWRVMCDNDILIMFRHFRSLMKKEWCCWEEENQEYLYTTDAGMEESANMYSKIFRYELPKSGMKALHEFIYRVGK